MPEWWLLVTVLCMLAALGVVWTPLLLALPLAAAAIGVSIGQALLTGWQTFDDAPARLRLTTGLLHLLQPLARLRGRLADRGQLELGGRGHPWTLPRTRLMAFWIEHWETPTTRLGRIHDRLAERGVAVATGGAYERFDLELRAGRLGAARLIMSAEDLGTGSQYFRFRIWPSVSRVAVAMAMSLFVLALAAAVDHGPIAALVLGAASLLLVGRVLRQCATAMGRLVWEVDSSMDERAGA
jgi:hypothetical protein